MENELQRLHSEAIPDEDTPEKIKPGYRRFVIDLLETIFLSLLIFFGINALSARIRVDGSSMEPTLHSGEFIIVNKLAYRTGATQFGDIVVFHFPRNPSQEYIKRVIGLPGDQVEIIGGQVIVNGNVLSEDYIAAPPTYEASWTVPDDAIFVLGDNRNNSSDSHAWGPVPLDHVVGKAVIVYWPPTEWGIVEHTTPGYATP